MQIFDGIRVRVVEDVLFISMDGVSGLEEGADPIFKDLTAQLKRVYGAPILKAARAESERFRQAWGRYPGAVDVWGRSPTNKKIMTHGVCIF